jgi:hypothetical protein
MGGTVSDLNRYLEKRGITEEEMTAARERTQSHIEA